MQNKFKELTKKSPNQVLSRPPEGLFIFYRSLQHTFEAYLIRDKRDKILPIVEYRNLVIYNKSELYKRFIPLWLSPCHHF